MNEEVKPYRVDPAPDPVPDPKHPTLYIIAPTEEAFVHARLGAWLRDYGHHPFVWISSPEELLRAPIRRRFDELFYLEACQQIDTWPTYEAIALVRGLPCDSADHPRWGPFAHETDDWPEIPPDDPRPHIRLVLPDARDFLTQDERVASVLVERFGAVREPWTDESF